MVNNISIFTSTEGLLAGLITAVVVLVVGLGLKKMFLFRLETWAKDTKTQLDDIVIDAIRFPLVLWIIGLAVYLGLKVAVLPEQWMMLLEKILQILWLFSMTLVVSQILSQGVKVYAKTLESTLPVTTLTENIVRIIVLAVGMLVILNSLGISIAPILATLGVGGLAVALALQDTLSNLFSGFHIIMSRQIKVGDFVRLDNGQEGYVTDINWRTTRIKMLPNNEVLIPNAKLAQAIVTNYYLPEKEMAVLVEVGVDYASDLKKVERITCEVGAEVMREIPGGIDGFSPFIRYHTFGDFSIQFTVILRAREFVDQYLIKHEFIKRLHERYHREGVVIPFPIRTVIQGG